MLKEELKKEAVLARLSILEAIARTKSSHIGSCFSIVDILVILYSGVMNINPKNFDNANRDIFVLSKGHAAVALYAVLAEKGFFDKEKIDHYGENGTQLAGHIIRDSLPGIEISSGSLGHGLSIVAGMALASNNNSSRRFYCLMGDGECNEGSVWEAAMFASHNKLNNLTAIIDFNGQQGMGKTEDIINQNNLAERFKSFGWRVYEVDGHNFDELAGVFKKRSVDKPIAIIAHTVKGKGVSFMENKTEWHYKSPNIEQLDESIKEINVIL